MHKYVLFNFKCSNMGLIRVSDLLDDEISCLGIDANFIYAAAGKSVYAFLFGRKVKLFYFNDIFEALSKLTVNYRLKKHTKDTKEMSLKYFHLLLIF
jgi:hypothetical protein